METIHFFDLDGTLWKIHGNAWVINKEKPNVPIIKLSNIELNDILSGAHKKDEILINYNGKDFWISEAMLNKIKKIRPTLTKDKLGISFIEMTDPYNFKKISIFKENIRHLINKTNFDIGILSARYSEENDKLLLKSLRDELGNIGLTINKFYYTGDYFKTRVTDKIAYDKSNILLEHLVGFKIENEHFVEIKQDKYNVVHFYDDEFKNIQVANEIQYLLDEYLKNTDDNVYDLIIGVIENEKPSLFTHLITNNSLNRFKTKKIELIKPITFPIKTNENNKFILKFNKFKNDKKI